MEVFAIPPEIQQLLARKSKAEAQPPEIRQQYADYYNLIVSKIVEYAIDHPLPTWDFEINSEILSVTLLEMSAKYENKKPYIEWMCGQLIPEVDVSFTTRNQARFVRCIHVARQQIGNV